MTAFIWFSGRSDPPLRRIVRNEETVHPAVIRNRIRRRLREVVRLNAPRLRSGWDLVLVARSRALEAPFDKLEAAYLASCGKLGLLKQEAGE